MQCHACRAEVVVLGRIGRRESCDACGADLHCCLNCRHHDLHAQNQCREPGTEPVRDRAASNFCDFFEPGSKPPAEEDPVAIARQKLEALFKK